MTRTSSTFRRAALVASTGLAMTLALPAFAAPGAGRGGDGGPHAGMGHGGCGPVSRLTVGGSGESRIAPDLAVIQLGVTSQADSAAAAMAQNGEQQSAVIEALKDSGIAAEEIQTSGINLNPMMDYGEGRAPQITGYQASNMVSVRVAEVERLGEVLDAIVAAGANEINGINFQREDGLAAEDDARRAAVEDARHKAEVLAEAAGLSLGPILLLRDRPANDGPQPMMMRAEAARGAGTPVETGQLSVTSEVEVVYALEGEGACGPKRGSHDHGGGADPETEMPEPGAQPVVPGEPPAAQDDAESN